jgi:DNA-binding NarL/FixJ family response regulator
VSDDGNDLRVTRAVAAGVRGYVTRDASADEMAQAIRAARSGLLVLDPDIAQALVQTVRQPSGSDLADDELALIEPLSERELDVLRLMTRGRSNKQIAAELSISEHTVKFHIRAILGKLGAANRTAAVTLALQKGLVSL